MVKKIMQAYEVEPNYTEYESIFCSNATEFRVILKNLDFTNEVLNSGRTEMEIKVIKEIIQSPAIRQKDLAEEVGVSASTVQRIIKKLVKEGKIVQMNGKRDRYWKIL